MTLVVAPTKMALVAGMILLMVVSFAAYTKYTETKAWIFGDGPYDFNQTASNSPKGLQVTGEEIARYPTLKAYIDYMDTMPGRKPLNSMGIDSWEAWSIVSLLSQRGNPEVKPQKHGDKGELYGFFIEVSGRFYSINILFNNERPVLD